MTDELVKTIDTDDDIPPDLREGGPDVKTGPDHAAPIEPSETNPEAETQSGLGPEEN